jgi:hypothetical protein
MEADAASETLYFITKSEMMDKIQLLVFYINHL